MGLLSSLGGSSGGPPGWLKNDARNWAGHWQSQFNQLSGLFSPTNMQAQYMRDLWRAREAASAAKTPRGVRMPGGQMGQIADSHRSADLLAKNRQENFMLKNQMIQGGMGNVSQMFPLFNKPPTQSLFGALGGAAASAFGGASGKYAANLFGM